MLVKIILTSNCQSSSEVCLGLFVIIRQVVPFNQHSFYNSNPNLCGSVQYLYLYIHIYILTQASLANYVFHPGHLLLYPNSIPHVASLNIFLSIYIVVCHRGSLKTFCFSCRPIFDYIRGNVSAKI